MSVSDGLLTTRQAHAECFRCKFENLGFPCRDVDGKYDFTKIAHEYRRSYELLDVHDLSSEKNPWAYECVLEMMLEDHEASWIFIKVAIHECGDKDYLGYLAAGPLEDLIQDHGTVFIDRIEELSRLSRKFRLSLSGIWLDEKGFEPGVYDRLETILASGPWFGSSPLNPGAGPERTLVSEEEFNEIAASPLIDVM